MHVVLLPPGPDHGFHPLPTAPLEVYTTDSGLEVWTPVDGVLSVNGGARVDERFDLMLKQLLRAAERRERIEALALLGRLVPEYGASHSAARIGADSA